MSATRILVVDDESEIRRLLQEILADEGYDVEAAANGAEARSLRIQQEPDLILLDIWMPDTDGITLLREWAQAAEGFGCPVVMMSGHGTVETAVEATRLGAFDFIEKPLSLAKLLRTVERALEAGKQKRQAPRKPVPAAVAPIGKSRMMQSLREQVQQVAPHDASVLILGEAGTGREAFARYVHSLSRRAAGPFVTLIAAGVADDSAMALLHGTESGDIIRPGLLEQANGGVLFVNSIEDLSPAAQRLLLADLESRVFVRVGGQKAVPLDVRLICSARPGVGQESGAVRVDLLAHLDVIKLHIPPLREYAEDVPDLLRHYVDRLMDDEQLRFRHFSVAAQNRLRNYPWPGNVGELKNLVKRLLILGGSEDIGLEEVERELAAQTLSSEPLVKQDLLALPLREAREQFERAYLQQQLILCNGKVGQLAKRVGMERTHLYRKLRLLGVDFRQTTDD